MATAVCKWARDSPAIGLPFLQGLWGTAAPSMVKGLGSISSSDRETEVRPARWC